MYVSTRACICQLCSGQPLLPAAAGSQAFAAVRLTVCPPPLEDGRRTYNILSPFIGVVPFANLGVFVFALAIICGRIKRSDQSFLTAGSHFNGFLITLSYRHLLWVVAERYCGS